MIGKKENHRITDIFQKDLFFTNVEYNNREDALNNLISKVEKVKKLPDDFRKLVWERENYSSTDLLPNVALPHPNKLFSDETFIATMILDKPIFWMNQNISIILLLCIKKEDSEQYKFIFDWIIKLFDKDQSVMKIVRDKKYETLEKELLELHYRGI